MKRNPHLAKLASGYLFPEINRRKKLVLEKNPSAKIISLGIGNTTEPLPPFVTKCLSKAAAELGTAQGYSGYGDEQGLTPLREKIAEVFYRKNGVSVSGDEIYISDGAKCDIGRLQLMFGQCTVAVQDPSYPVYVDGSVLIGATGKQNDATKQFDGITYMRCVPENDFFPDLSKMKRTDVIYFCSPNNPTGAVATKKQLRELVDFAKKNKSILVFDAAYSEYIVDSSLPRSIFEIDGAREVAIEVNSFSKSFGFTGVRLGYVVVPKELKYDDGELVSKDWNRIVTTVFNGASNLVQKGMLYALQGKGLSEMKQVIGYYQENAKILHALFSELRLETYGGVNSPYLWVRFPKRQSWDVFTDILEHAHVVTTPGSGFGPAGEGFLRFSSYGHRKDVVEAVGRLRTFLKK